MHIDFIDTGLSTERAADIIVVQMLQVLDENDSRDKSRKVLFGIEEGIKRAISIPTAIYMATNTIRNPKTGLKLSRKKPKLYG